MVGVDELLESLTAASAEVEQRNFGRALRRVERARQLLDGPNVPPQIRDSIGPQLVEIRGRLEQLDPVVGERLASLARDLEQGLATTAPPPSD
jgi:hypothetical protein